MSTPPPNTTEEPHDPAPLHTVRFVARDGGTPGAILTALSVCVWAVIGLCVIVGRTLFVPPAPLVLFLTFLPYVYAAALAWSFSLWAAAPDRKVPPVLLLITVLAGLFRWGPSVSVRLEETEGESIRVMSWNVRRLWGGPDEALEPKRCVAQAIRAESPDVLTLLEVSAEDVDELSKSLGLTCVYTTYHGGGERKKGGLASCVYGQRWTLTGGAQRFVDSEQWYYVFSELTKDDQVFNLLSVHFHPYWLSTTQMIDSVSRLFDGETEPLFDLSRTGRRVVGAQSDQAAALLDRVRRFNDPTVVAGDFNSTRDLALHRALREELTDSWERAGHGLGGTVRVGGRLPIRVDYVYATDDFEVHAARVLPIDCSDHRPVIVDLILRGRPVQDGVH